MANGNGNGELYQDGVDQFVAADFNRRMAGGSISRVGTPSGPTPFDIIGTPATLLLTTVLTDYPPLPQTSIPPSSVRYIFYDLDSPPAPPVVSAALPGALQNAQLVARVTTDALGILPAPAGIEVFNTRWPTFNAGGAPGEANTASNQGTGAQVFKQKTGVDLEMRTLTEGSGITLTQSADEIEIATSIVPGEANTASNQGTGAQVFKQKTGVDLEMRTLTEGANIVLTQSADEVEIAAVVPPPLLGLSNAVDPDNDDVIVSDRPIRIGAPGAGEGLSVGEGDHFVTGMSVKRNTNLEVGVFDDQTENATSPSASAFDAFPGVGVGNTLFIGADRQFQGCKIDTTIAVALGAGSLIWEYWAGAAWVEFNVMNTSIAPAPISQGRDSFQSVAIQNIRGPDAVAAGQALKVIDGENKFWIRVRVAVAITTSPTLESVRIHSNQTKFHASGESEYFGLARKSKQLQPTLGQDAEINGQNPADINAQYSAGIEVKHKKARFDDGTDEALPFIFGHEDRIDTSEPLLGRLRYFVDGAGTGDLEWLLSLIVVRDGDTLGALPVSVTSIIETIAAPSDQVIRTATFSLDVSELVEGDYWILEVERDATGGNANDTIAENVALVALELTGRLWK